MRTKQDNVNHVIKWRNNTKNKLVNAMGGECQGCGYDICTAALELHHIDPTQKELSFGKVTSNPRKWKVIMAEAKKCVLVCSNCHKEIHFGIRECPIPPKFIEPEDPIYQKDMLDACPICGNDKPKMRKTCSLSCGAKIRYDVNWDDEKLKEMLDNKISLVKIGAHFGCSDNGVRKRAKKLKFI